MTANVNAEYKRNARTSGEIVSIVVGTPNEAELLSRINTISSWIDETVIWA